MFGFGGGEKKPEVDLYDTSMNAAVRQQSGTANEGLYEAPRAQP